MGLQLKYRTRRGGSGCRSMPLDVEKVEAIMSRLKQEARLELDGEVIGSVEYRPELFDDKRNKWWWWFDPAAIEEAKAKKS